jgi:hypothetical protein
MKNINKIIKRGFGGGPYNPHRYKTHMVPNKIVSKEDIRKINTQIVTIPQSPVRNMRHVNPIRQSGPLPPYDGPVTMEDIRKIFYNTSVGYDEDACHQHPEELMRRVPGLTRKEAEHIVTLGLNPDEEIDYAYIAYNLGLDVFYQPNSVYVARQVMTDSKGQKQEIYLNAQAYEDISVLNIGHAPSYTHTDYHWEIFLWGELAIHPLVDFDLSVPATWFEYEDENWGEFNMIEDQFSLPEDVRKPSEKHPNCSTQLWYSQEDLDKIEELKDPNWVPKQLPYDLYNDPNFISNRTKIEENSARIN